MTAMSFLRDGVEKCCWLNINIVYEKNKTNGVVYSKVYDKFALYKFTIQPQKLKKKLQNRYNTDKKEN